MAKKNGYNFGRRWLYFWLRNGHIFGRKWLFLGRKWLFLGRNIFAGFIISVKFFPPIISLTPIRNIQNYSKFNW